MFQNIHFNALVVCPIIRRGQFYGVVSAKMDKKHGKFTDQELRFAEIVAAAISLVLSSYFPMPLELRKPA